MPLPPPVPRDELHLRRVEMRGYLRHDGLYDIEAHFTDTKSKNLALSERTVPAGVPIHDMWLRLVVDEELTVHDVIAVTVAEWRKHEHILRGRSPRSLANGVR